MMKALSYAAVAAAVLFSGVGALAVTASPTPPGLDAPLRLAVVGADVAGSRRLLPLVDLPRAWGTLTKFTSSTISAADNEARSQVSGLTVAGGTVQAATVGVYCRDGAAQSHVTGLQTLLPMAALTADVRHKNPDGSTTITGLRLQLPAAADRPSVIVDVAVATCAPARDKPTVVLPGLPAALREALLHEPYQGRRDATARPATITVGSRAANGGC
ncbi:hypothetical protein [Actinoplanes sp. NPDC026619]|uniref:hypothetical protein n=1 Tax=Actinoplanes sp. NPDC026619 TaxID=3155798 RepID=UPI0033DD1072